MKMELNKKVVVCGAGGFIGGSLVKRLRENGYQHIRAVDAKRLSEWYQPFEGVENLTLDLRSKGNCELAVKDCHHIYNLAADMGGMGFIENNKTLCMLNVLINTHLLMAAKAAAVERYFYASSACIYAQAKQLDPENEGLRESDAYPAMPEDGYGWEKLFSERMCQHFLHDEGLATRCGRYHNIYGPFGTFEGGREKAPAALIRKVILAKRSGANHIEVWGDGEQTRSFTYIDDALEGTLRLMHSSVTEPLNIGSAERVTINQLIDSIEAIAGVRLKRVYQLEAPKGVRGRNSDNTQIKALLNWEPSTSLHEGLERTYRWIYDRLYLQKT